jgi:hypothetical protein
MSPFDNSQMQAIGIVGSTLEFIFFELTTGAANCVFESNIFRINTASNEIPNNIGLVSARL